MSSNKRQTYNSPVGFIGLRKEKGAPFTVSKITNILEFPRLISPHSEEFQVGSMLTHINGACICKSSNVPTLLTEVVSSIAFVNNLVAWEAIKHNPTMSFGPQVSLAKNVTQVAFDNNNLLSKNGFCAKGHRGRAAVLTVVSAEFSHANAVGVGDLLLSVDGVCTLLMNARELEVVLMGELDSF